MPIDRAAVESLVAGNTAVALDLYARLASGDGNVCFSPYGISIAFAMTCAGARGETARQLARALHLPPEEETHAGFAALETALGQFDGSRGTSVRSANRLWPQQGYGFLEPFVKLLIEAYHADVRAVDYERPDAARDEINRWVEERTAGRIRDLVSPGELTPLTRLVLVNAIYLKADWQHPFSADATHPLPFTLESGRQVTASMMRQTAMFRYAEEPDLQVLEMPYADPDLGMVILLPRRPDGLAEVQRRLTPEYLQALCAGLRDEQVHVLLPRFRVEGRIGLEPAMRSLGVSDAFDPDRADFSGMDGRSRWLSIGAAAHGCFVKVDEQGTEAAGATFVAMFYRSLPRQFGADHPFLFLIRQRSTGNILFLGRLADPTVQ